MARLLVFLCFISVLTYGQSVDSVYSIIKTQKSEKHVNIPGTRMYIIPPPGFTLSKNFNGLQNGNSAIIVYDISGSSFRSNEQNFDRSKFERKGLKVYDARNISIDGYEGKYLYMQNDSLSSAYTMIFGDSSFFTMLIATFSNSDVQTSKDVVQALNSIYYEKLKRVDPFESAQFMLDDTVTKLKFCKYVGVLYTYTVGGIENKSGQDNPVAIVTQFPLPNGGSPKSVSDTILSKTESGGFKTKQVKNNVTFIMNGYDAFEAEVYGELDNKKTLIYQFAVSNGSTVVTFQGVDEDEDGKWLNEFKLLAHSIKFK